MLSKKAIGKLKKFEKILKKVEILISDLYFLREYTYYIGLGGCYVKI